MKEHINKLQLSNIITDRPNFLNHAEFAEGERKEFVIISAKLINKRVSDDGKNWKDVVKELSKFDPKTKEVIIQVYTPQVYELEMYEKRDKNFQVRKLTTNPVASVNFFKNLFEDKELKDVMGMEVVLEKVSNGNGFNPSVLPIGA